MYGLRSREEGLRFMDEGLGGDGLRGKEDVDGLFVKQIDRKRHLRDLLFQSRKAGCEATEKCSAVRVSSLSEAP